MSSVTSLQTSDTPAVVRDARFRAGRTLIATGRSSQAVATFATLLQEARLKYGDSHLETAPAYYEYGNALFRSWQRQQEESEKEGEEGKERDDQTNPDEETTKDSSQQLDRRALAAAAAERRNASVKSTSASDDKNINKVNQVAVSSNGGGRESVTEDSATAASSTSQTDDVVLALEMMENAWSLLDQSLTDDASSHLYKEWISEQIPRVLIGLGDVLSALGRHPDSVDAYLRALKYRQEDLSRQLTTAEQTDELQLLISRRRVVEVYILIAQEILECPRNQDVVTSESKDVLVKAKDIVEYAHGYYDKARDELQEAVLLMGKLVGGGLELKEEKENVCFAATMIMGVGGVLAELEDELPKEADATNNKKVKRQKTNDSK